MRSKKEEETPVPYKRDRTVQRPSKKDVKCVQFPPPPPSQEELLEKMSMRFARGNCVKGN